MDETVEFVARQGYLLVFAAVLFEQLGVPLPTILVLIPTARRMSPSELEARHGIAA